MTNYTQNLYSYKGKRPSTLPNLIPTESGNFLTNTPDLTDDILRANGYIRAEDMPTVEDRRFFYITWENSAWVIKERSDEEKSAIIEAQWDKVRTMRDRMMALFDWRYVRYSRELRLGLPTHDTLEQLDSYMQALANITAQSDPYNIVWPTIE
jgi:hypothetical protein